MRTSCCGQRQAGRKVLRGRVDLLLSLSTSCRSRLSPSLPFPSMHQFFTRRPNPVLLFSCASAANHLCPNFHTGLRAIAPLLPCLPTPSNNHSDYNQRISTKARQPESTPAAFAGRQHAGPALARHGRCSLATAAAPPSSSLYHQPPTPQPEDRRRRQTKPPAGPAYPKLPGDANGRPLRQETEPPFAPGTGRQSPPSRLATRGRSAPGVAPVDIRRCSVGRRARVDPTQGLSGFPALFPSPPLRISGVGIPQEPLPDPPPYTAL